MTIIHLSASELKEHDRRRFDYEYYKWCAHDLWDDWHENEIAELIAKCAALDITVRPHDVHWSGFWSQGDGLGFSGTALLDVALARMGKKNQYLALWYSLRDFGAKARIDCRGNHISFVDVWHDFSPGHTHPDGIFKDLPLETWDELVAEQADEVLDQVGRYLLDECRDLADECYRALQADYEYLTSEESFIESCEINEVTFEVEGEDE